MWSDDPLVRMRAADAAEKVTRGNPELLQPFKKQLLSLMAETSEQELRWHLAAMVPRLRLSTRDLEARCVFDARLSGRPQFHCQDLRALQGLADLARHDASLLPKVMELLRESTRSGTAAMKARSRKLLLQLEGR